jgi:hypothetical protein
MMKVLHAKRRLLVIGLGLAASTVFYAAKPFAALVLAQDQDSTVPNAPTHLSDADHNPCLEEPESSACESYQLLQQVLQEREARQQQALTQLTDEFAEEFGYNPADYELTYRLAGNNNTIFDKSDWITFEVEPEAGLISVGHRAATRDAFWGTMVWHDHEVTSVEFTLDEDACQVVSDGEKCTFIGVDTIDLGHNFLTEHQIIKHGQWQVNYIESDEEKGLMLRVPDDVLPVGAASEDLASHNRQYCRLFPNSLDCQ